MGLAKTGSPVYLFVGMPGDDDTDIDSGYEYTYDNGVDYQDTYMFFMRCYNDQCRHIRIEFGGSGSYDECPQCGSKSDEFHPQFQVAIDAARAARFENISKSSPVVTSRVKQPVVMPAVKYTNIKCTWCRSYIPSAESNRAMLMLQFDYTVRTHVRLVNVRIICGKCFIAAHKWSESANAIISEDNLFWDFTYPKLVNFPIFFGDEYTYAYIPDDEMKYIESIASQLGQELPIRSNELH